VHPSDALIVRSKVPNNLSLALRKSSQIVQLAGADDKDHRFAGLAVMIRVPE